MSTVKTLCPVHDYSSLWSLKTLLWTESVLSRTNRHGRFCIIFWSMNKDSVDTFFLLFSYENCDLIHSECEGIPNPKAYLYDPRNSISFFKIPIQTKYILKLLPYDMRSKGVSWQRYPSPKDVLNYHLRKVSLRLLPCNYNRCQRQSPTWNITFLCLLQTFPYRTLQ